MIEAELPLSRVAIDRSAAERQNMTFDVVAGESGARVVTVGSGSVVLRDGSLAITRVVDVDCGRAWPPGWAFLGRDSEGPWLARFDADDAATSLIECGASLSARDAGLATAAVALSAWHATHPCCPRCGTQTVVVEAGWARQCPSDNSMHYPRTDPAVIVAVTSGAPGEDRLLLARSARRPGRRFSLIAGFVDAGESFEAAVHRELLEETSIAVEDIRFLAAQPWPFPASLMLAAAARAVTTDITVDGEEIAEARWFTRAQLTDAVACGDIELPMPTSIARVVIEEWMDS